MIRRSAFCSILFVMWQLCVPAYALVPFDFKQHFLDAEQQYGVGAISAWKILLAKAEYDESSVPDNISIAQLRIHLITSMLEEISASQNSEDTSSYITEINNHARLLPPKDRVWALTMLARAQITNPEKLIAEQAVETLNKAYEYILSIKDVSVRHHALHGLINTVNMRNKDGMLYFSHDALALTQKWTPHIAGIGWHYSDALLRIAAIIHPNKPQRYFVGDIGSALLETTNKKRDDALETIAHHAIETGKFSRAYRASSFITDGKKAAKALGELAIARKMQGYDTQAAALWKKALFSAEHETKPSRHEAAQKEIERLGIKWEEASFQAKPHRLADAYKVWEDAALNAANNHDILTALLNATHIDDAQSRIRALRRVAETYAQQLDHYGLLSGKYIAPEPVYTEQVTSYKNVRSNDGDISIEATTMPPSRLGYRIPNPFHLQRLTSSSDDIRINIPLPTHAHITRLPYTFGEYLSAKFDLAIGYQETHSASAHTIPYYLYLSGGIIDLPQLYDILQRQGYNDDMTRDGNSYMLRKPLVIAPSATLIIDGSDTSQLLLSVQGAAQIINAGTLYIYGADIAGWDEKKDAVAYAIYDERHRFRPFINSWAGSHTDIAASRLSAMGYNSFKAYGLTLSSGPQSLDPTGTALTRPTGRIINNSFYNFYYGFYSYEADDIVLIGNEYVDNIVYGLDPHDRSRRLTMAYNTAYGTHEKHGIIISREVNDSAFIGNISVGNKGSGFMIDRESVGTITYANTAMRNGGDGMTLFESSCNLIAANRFDANKSMGIRIRNSRDNAIFFNLMRANSDSGLHAYSEHLQSSPNHQHRNFTKDSYSQVTDFIAIRNIISYNHTGVSILDISGLMMHANRFLFQSPRRLRGDWFEALPYLLSQYDMEKNGIALRATCTADTTTAHPCPFRNGGWFNGELFDDSSYASTICVNEAAQ